MTKVTEKQKEEIERLKKAGEMPDDISKELGIPLSTVYYYYSREVKATERT